jgi:predicted esterase
MQVPDETWTFSVPLACRYVVRPPAAPAPAAGLAVVLHGYGSSPEAMLGLSAPLFGPSWALASVQAPNQHYLTTPQGGVGSSPMPAYNWGIRDHWLDAVRLHHAMVLHVLRDLRERFALERSQCLLAGFSQPVGLNYRFCATYPGEVGGVLGICGGVPRDWEESGYQPVTAALLHIARSEDEYYPVPVVEQFERRLRLRADDVEFHLLPGPHRFPSKAQPIIRAWLGRVFELRI